MKKVIAILVVFLGITTAEAQRGKKGDFEKMTPEQRTELTVKKLTLKLDLTPAQTNQIKPLLLEQAKERKAMHAKRKAMKESGKKPTADQRYAMASARLDKQIALKAEMKQILNEKQYEKFEKIAALKMNKMKKYKKGKHGRKDKKRNR